MFFKKKRKSVPEPTTRENRAQYRKHNSKSQPLEATLRVSGWEPITVELIDLTVRGAGLRLPFAQDRNLKVDDVVEITVGTMMRSEIVTPARVANVGRDGDSHVRYGVEFLNVGSLYSQLDAFYARYFNRRRNLRVLPSLDRKIQATLRWNGGEHRAHVYDVSETGIGVVVSKDTAAQFAEIPGFEISFQLPGRPGECKGRAAVRHRSPLFNQILLGLKFDLDQADGMQLHTAALRQFIDQRAAEMAMWEKSWS